ncbi:NfeD family protein [Streptomyces sp. NPDC048172]|uniref:NfeD family protein n=1 Tax=Streptomyces sp. NPDC048172 TaxID=3365505 RepID=UPI00371656FC
MSNIERASQDAVEAARQGEQFAMMLAAVQAAQQPQATPCQHHQAPARPPFDARKAVTYTACACVGTAFLTLFFLAFAIGAFAVGVAALVLWSVWKGVQPRKG